MYKTILLLILLPASSFAQKPVNGNATISFVEADSLCGGAQKRVDVFVDVTGLTGQGGDAGLNAFAIHVLLDDASFYVGSAAGSDPISFALTSTQKTLIGTLGALRLVGYNADTNAPNTEYHVASIFVGNQLGSVTLDLDLATTSLGSRVVGGAGPGPISFVFDGPLTVTVDTLSPYQLGDALAAWLTDDPLYDLNAPFGVVDILDLVAISQCAAP